MMNKYPISRDEIIQTIVEALKPFSQVHAVWEGGAAAFQRVDEWSDIDLQADVDDSFVDKVFPIVEEALSKLAPMDLRYEIPRPAWHGHEQVFYRLQNTSPFLLIDLVAIRHSLPNKFLEPEIHGQAVMHFDRSNVVGSSAPIDPAAWRQKLEARRAELRILFPLFQTLTLKEINRGNTIEAFAFYQAYTVRPLVEALRIHHSPMHYNFHTRYIQYELPPEVTRHLEDLFFVKDLDDLREKQQRAENWFWEAVELK